MVNLNGRRVIRGRLHGPLHITGIGSIASVLDENSAKVNGALKLIKVEGGVYGEFKGGTFFVPESGFLSLELYPEEPLAAKVGAAGGGIMITNANQPHNTVTVTNK